jgi:hypothetical protein
LAGLTLHLPGFQAATPKRNQTERNLPARVSTQDEGWCSVTKQELLKKLDAIADEFQKTRSWGSLEVEFKDGEANYVRKTFSESVREDAHAQTCAQRIRQ